MKTKEDLLETISVLLEEAKETEDLAVTVFITQFKEAIIRGEKTQSMTSHLYSTINSFGAVLHLISITATDIFKKAEDPAKAFYVFHQFLLGYMEDYLAQVQSEAAISLWLNEKLENLDAGPFSELEDM